MPDSITIDYGPEFESRVLDARTYLHGGRLPSIQPGKDIENAYVESFNGRLRDECLIEHWFADFVYARRVIETWRIEYNTERLYNGLPNHRSQR